MSKAYDSVNFELFQKSLLRLQMPQQLINILSNLLFNRTNRVITNLGLTNFYSVKNGIDQGETITPLFWRIYYDPLITHISTHFSGYTLSTTWQPCLTYPSTNHLHTSISVLAYMDDTIWITQSKEELDKIINTATSFYNMANIQINPTKSTFISKQPSASISFLHSNLASIPIHQPFKFLGCWFTLNNKHTQQIKLIQDEAIQLANIANTKNITDKQITYIINTVIIPTTEYRIQNIVIPLSTCNKILGKYLTIAKHKSHLSRSTPNSTMLNHYLYNIHSLWDIQLQHHTSNFLNRINNPSTLGLTTQIRIQQLQNNLWSTTSIFHHPNPLIDGPNRHTTTFKIIQLFNSLNISISSNPNLSWPQTPSGGNLPLENIFSQHPKYHTFKQQLRHKNLLFLEQLCSADNKFLLDWSHLSPRLLHIPKGKKPAWFSFLEDSILSHTSNRTIIPSFQPSGHNLFAFQTNLISKSSKPWLLTSINNEIIIGQIRKTFHQSNTVSINHWQHNIDISHSSCFSLPPISCKPCPGCSLNSSRIANYCTLEVSSILSTQFLGRKSNNQLKLNANYIDLIQSATFKNPSYIPPPPSINIADSLVPTLFYNNSASNNLAQIATANNSYQHFTFYTDGSVKNFGTDQCTMGIGWAQIHNNSVTHNFSAQITNWPSSYKAELFAILSAISTLPRNSTVDIYTDSQSIISKYNKLIQSPYFTSKYFKFNSWPIWHTLLNSLKAYNINLTFHKVQAHTNDIFNNLADFLANNHASSPILTLNYSNLHNPYFFLKWKNYSIDSPARYFIKKICKAKTIAMWSSQKRNQEWSHFSHHIDWNSTWLYFNNNQKSSSNFTNLKLNHLKSFKVKILLNNLPTHFYFHSIFPNLFLSSNCFQCNLPDSSSHWYTCSSHNSLTQIINSCISETISKFNLNLSTLELNYLKHTISSHPSFSPHPSPLYPYSLHSTLKDLIPIPLIQSVQTFDLSYSLASQLIIQTLLKISNQLYDQIWKTYCINFSTWKRAHQISSNFSHTQSPHPYPRTLTRTRNNFTYNCPCNTPDQLHSDPNTCPPSGLANRKFDSWSTMWIQYNTSINYILTIQI